MNHQLVQSLTEYRTWAWGLYQDWLNHNNPFYRQFAPKVAKVLGLCPVYECWESIFDQNGVWIYDVDEFGGIIPDNTAESVTLDEWVKEVDFPAVVVYAIHSDIDRLGLVGTCVCDCVSMNEFFK